MITRLFSAALRGVEAQEVEVEVNARGADKPLIILKGIMKISKAAHFITDFTDFNGFHGEDGNVLSKYQVTLRVNSL